MRPSAWRTASTPCAPCCRSSSSCAGSRRPRARSWRRCAQRSDRRGPRPASRPRPRPEVDDMNSVLVVANQTIGGSELRKELRKRVEAGQCSFYVVVPNTAAAHYHVVPAAGGFVPMPSLDVYGPATDEEATEEARERLRAVLAELTEM